MAAVISACILKKTSKLVNFFVAILILKMEEKKQHVRYMCFIISRKVKMQPKHKKRFVQCIEKVLLLIERVKSGWQSFMLEISRWTMLHGWAGQLKSIAIKSRRSLRTINVISLGR